jgi:O-antigen ligase
MTGQDMKVKIQGVFKWLYFWLVILFFICLIFSFRFFVTLSLVLMLACAVAYHRLEQGKWWNKSFLNLFTGGCFLYFIIQGAALLYTCNFKAGSSILLVNLGLLAIPVATFYSNLVNKESYSKMMAWYTGILFLASLIALIHAFFLYIGTGNPTFFFYHPLVHMYSNHAIQFSLLTFLGILFLLDEYSMMKYIKSRKWILSLLIYFSVFLFLLTSKMTIILYFLYIIYLIVFTDKFFRNRSFRLSGIAVILMALFFFLVTKSPLRQRLSEDFGTNISFIEHDKYRPADYFNGVQFRLVSWRFAYEILNDNNRWLIGVSPGDAQDMLNTKYKTLNMFTGGLPDNKKGYLDYHTHNQFLQAVLETGLLGLSAFILICAGMIRLAVISRKRSMVVLTILLLCYCFVDAVLKTQYGIILFILFPLFTYKGTEAASEVS